MRITETMAVCFLLFCIAGCDPGLKGDLKVFNEANHTLKIKYSNSPMNAVDTVTAEIGPGVSILVNGIGGLGNKKSFECCADRTRIFSISSSNGLIKKDPANCNNWAIPNKSKLRKYGGEKIKCEFHITPADI